ncbi:hypothetical protein ACEWY4_006511 [Coilia grayii]|uniref:RIIa domain-containing protein n=1 Tax=Coilia grayii TaxID=363190 RepID=A0ABD1KDM8_9TELE
MACWKVSRPTLLIPYGVKSFLECVCRAYRIEDPHDIKQFMAEYCKDLLENRDRSPSRDIRHAIRLYQKMRELDQVTENNWSMHSSPEVTLVSLPSGEPAGMYQDPPCTAGSVSLLSCRLTHDALTASQNLHIQPSTGDIHAATVQSAVFQRVPSRSDFTEIQGSVLINSASAPPADVIVVHSENLPDAILFHSDSRPSSALSVRSCASKTLSLTDVDGTEECGVEDGIVVFERVPSKEEFSPAQSSVEVECGELQSSEVIDRPLTSAEEDQCSEVMETESDMLTLAAQEPPIVKQASPKRSLVRVFSAHVVESEDSFGKMGDGSEQLGKTMPSRTSLKTFLTECPGSCGPAVNDIGETSDFGGPIPHATDSPSEASPHLVMSVDLSEESELEGTPAMAATVDVVASTETDTVSGSKDLADECLDEAIRILRNTSSSESTPDPGEIMETDEHPGKYSEAVTLSGVAGEDGVARLNLPTPPAGMPQDTCSDSPNLAASPQTLMSVFESVSAVYIEKREETVAQEQSDAAAAEASDLTAEFSGKDTAESTETYINTTECSPPEALHGSVVSVSPARSPILMDKGGIAEADDLNLVTAVSETLADGTEMSPAGQVHPEIYGLPDDLTSPSDGTCTLPEDTKVIAPARIHYLDENLTDIEKTADVGTTEVSTKTSLSSGNHLSAEILQGFKDQHTPLKMLLCLRCSPIMISAGAECPEKAENDLKADVKTVLSGIGIEAECLSEPVEANVDFVDLAGSPMQENMRGTADEDDLNRMAEFLEDNSEFSHFKKEQAEETPGEQEHTVLTSTADEDTANTAIGNSSVEMREAETAAQEPSAEDVLCAAAPSVQSVVLSKSSGNDSAECPETAENVLQVDVESVSARYSGSEITERLAPEPVQDYRHSMAVVSSSSEEHMREDTETGPAAHTPEPAVSHTHSPCAFPESEEFICTHISVNNVLIPVADGPETYEVEFDVPHHTDLNREEEVVGPDSFVKGSLLNTCLYESLETETFQQLEIAETVVPQDIDFVPAEDSIEHRLISPDGLSQETMNGNNKMDDLSVGVMGVPKAASDVLEECSTGQVLSEDSKSSKLSDNMFAQVVTASEENANILEATISSNIPSARITKQEEKTSRSGETTDRGTSPIISPKTSSMLVCVHASTQVSGLSFGVMATGSQGDQSRLSDNDRPGSPLSDNDLGSGPPCLGNNTTTPPTNRVQTESGQDEEQQDNTENAFTERGTPCTDSVLQSPVNQMWTLYHLPYKGEEGTFCTDILSQPPFNGSAYIRSFGPGHVLLAERSPPSSSHNLHQAPERVRKGLPQASGLHHHHQRPQDVAPAAKDAATTLPSRSPLESDTLEISLPNYLLCLDGSKEVTPLMGGPEVPAQAVRVRRDAASGLLSFSLPMDSVGGSQRRNSHAQFLQMTTDQGHSVYSPALLRIVTCPADQNQK